MVTRPSPELAKREMVAELGETALVLPSLVNRGLEANGRAKYLLSLVQSARARADERTGGVPGGGAVPSLHDERLEAGVADGRLDSVVEAARQEAPDRYFVPHVGTIHTDLVDALAEMIAPLALPVLGDAAGSAFRHRLDALRAATPDLSGDRIDGTYIDRMTSARPGEGDSFHALVMDLHRSLSGLQSRIASTSVDGAAAYGLLDEDRPMVAAFMAGLHETEDLKLDHPGLATTATRTTGRLLIQNDLGTTKAHVVVVAVSELTVTVTYSDVHLRRLQFLESLFGDFDVTWSAAQPRGGAALGEHHLTIGTYRAPDQPSLESFLHRIGSRLVFVLDWNRARKRLRSFLSNQDAVEVLRWAADNDLGHMSFLSLGGERFIYEAVELSDKVPARYGEPLVEVLGRDAALAVTKFAFRSATEGLLAGKSTLLIRDEVRIEVLRHVQAAQHRLLDAGAEHAGLVVECAQTLQGALVRLGTDEGGAFLARAVQRAAGWEHRADEILIAQRETQHRVADIGTVTALTTAADDAIDCLEECIFLLTLLEAEGTAVARPILEPLSAIVARAAREHLKAVAFAREIIAGPAPDDLEDFLVAVDRVATLEHDADAADRLARAALVQQAPEFRSLYVADSICRGAEDAADALLRSALGLRDHILSVVAS